MSGKMRHINKFKVWDHELNCWVPERTMIDSGGNLHIDVAGKEWTEPGDPERFTVCKYTGEYDSNDHDIFNCDILKIEYDDGETTEALVYFECGAYVVDCDFGEADTLPIGWAILHWQAEGTKYTVAGTYLEDKPTGESDEKN